VDVLLQMPGRAANAWRDALAEALPDAAIAVWPEAPPAPAYACVWRPPDELFARVRPTKAIFNLGAGVDALLAVPTLPRDVPVIRLEDAGMAEQMAEYATLAVLRAYREADVYVVQQREARWHPRERLAKAEFGVGLLGCGVLGRAIAAALAPFGFPLAGWSRARKSLPGVAVYGRDEFASFLAASDALVCTLPLTPETTGLLDRAALAQLPRGAHVINMARGEIIVDEDLLALLDEGHLSGATLDVFRVEPLPREHAFWHHPRITVTPHVSAVTLVPESIAQIAAKIRRIERGESVSGIVDRDRGY
jgi:glyoxylate/hydroxypyruvate reductase